ncbi:MAG: hypothetical protein KDJ99_32000 [Candidatus Competibacteraceae bacterium]|nr:hypothetical protein [Candidatus Competibacteraceae bacterium]
MNIADQYWCSRCGERSTLPTDFDYSGVAHPNCGAGGQWVRQANPDAMQALLDEALEHATQLRERMVDLVEQSAPYTQRAALQRTLVVSVHAYDMLDNITPFKTSEHDPIRESDAQIS